MMAQLVKGELQHHAGFTCPSAVNRSWVSTLWVISRRTLGGHAVTQDCATSKPTSPLDHRPYGALAWWVAHFALAWSAEYWPSTIELPFSRIETRRGERAYLPKHQGSAASAPKFLRSALQASIRTHRDAASRIISARPWFDTDSRGRQWAHQLLRRQWPTKL